MILAMLLQCFSALLYCHGKVINIKPYLFMVAGGLMAYK